MNTMKWLMKREYWEHKGGFFWAPAVVGAIMAIGIALTVAAGLAMGSKHGMSINGEQVTNLGQIVDAQEKAEIIQAVSSGYMAFSAPLFLIMSIVVFFFCLGSLFDERKDRSVLFWKSLPVSDAETVLSKAAMALVAAPVITLGVGIVVSLVIVLIACIGAAATGLNMFGALLASPDLYTSPFLFAALIPVYVVWALPTVGWLMMVSAWARTKVFLWAVGVPVLTGVLLLWFNEMFNFNWDLEGFWKHIVARLLLSGVPGAWFGFVDPSAGMHVENDSVDFSFLVAQSWKSLASFNAWIGAVVGSAMIFAAIRLRRWKDEG